MGVITPDRFNPIKAFCNVRLQQGVPLVDADVNELDDIRKFEVRAFLKWFVGNGIPDGNDGFRIAAPAPSADDFMITAGAQLAAVGTPPDITVPSVALNEFSVAGCGRCIVDGLDVIIRRNIAYKSQPLHVSQPGAAKLAAAYGVPVIDDIPSPAATGPVIVYLDIWERQVAPSEDASLVVPPLGTESCVRLKREWVVRTAVGLALPKKKLSPHHYYVLAVINRRIAGGIAQPIQPADITDKRDQHLLMPPSTLIPDVLGISATEYRQGHSRPAISLRDALNTLLRGEVPATAEIPVTMDLNDDLASYAFVVDQAGGVNAVWTSNRNLGMDQVFAARWTPTDLGARFSELAMITSATSPPTMHLAPSAAILPNGDAIVAYSTGARPPPNLPHARVFFKHAPRFIDMAQTSVEVPVVSATTVYQRAPFVVPMGSADGGTVVFFFHESTAVPRWVYQRRAYTSAWDEASAKWTDAAGQPLSNVLSARTSPEDSPPTSSGDFHAACDGAGQVWVAYRAVDPAAQSSAFTAIQVVQLVVATNALATHSLRHVGSGTTERAPFVLADASSPTVWVFWQSDAGIYAQQYRGGTTVGGVALVPDTSAGTHANPCAVRDTTGAIWLFWESDRGGTGSRIWCNRLGAHTGAWGSACQITGPTLPDTQPFAVLGPNGNVWLFWRRISTETNGNLYFKQILTAI